MRAIDQIRRSPLRTAIQKLAYEPAAQEHPILLLFLQNITERVVAHDDCLADLQELVRPINARLNALHRAIDRGPVVAVPAEDDADEA